MEPRQEQIHFANGLKEIPNAPLLAFAPQFAVWAIIGVNFVFIAIVVILGMWVSRHVGPGAFQWYLGAVILIVLAIAARLLFKPARQAYRDGMELSRLPLVADEAPRVRCIGMDAAVRRLGEISRDPFEPLIVRVVLVDRPSAGFIFVWLIGMLVTVGATVALMRSSATGALGAFPLSPFTSFYFAFGLAGGAFIAGFVFPAYIRIAPGRVDVLKFPALGLGKPTIIKHDVRNGAVTVLLGQRAALFKPVGDEHSSLKTVMYAGAFDRNNIARAILAASISEHPTPPMPDDALIG